MMGRMNASYRFFTYGAIPLGALLGGGLAGVIGLRATLLVGALGLVLAVLWVLLSPVRHLAELPTQLTE
jgi:predicted MFS family arabinose efflux permease